jgi:nucleoside-diphosphate-sugar epimerase
LAIIAVTGSAGFVGGGLMPLFGENGIALVRDPARATGGARHLAFDDPERLADALRGVDAVVALGGLAHQGGNVSDADMRKANAALPEALALAAAQAGVRTFVYVSSTKVFGRPTPGQVFTDDSPRQPACAYGRSKAEGEDRVAAVAARTGLRVVVLRPPLVYGSGAKGNLALLSRLIRWRIPLPVGALRDNRRTLVSRDSLCDAIAMAAAMAIPPGRYIVCDDDALSTRQIVGCMSSRMKWPPALVPVPPSLLRRAFGVAGMPGVSENLVDTMECSAVRLKQASSWRPSSTTAAGLARLV